MVSSSILRSRLIQKPYQLFHYHFLLEKQPGSTLSDLSFETNLKISIQNFKRHTWTLNEICHYGFLTSIIFFVFISFPASFLIKIPILCAFSVCFLIPLTSQFFVHALPIFTWLAFYFSAGKIPPSWRPAISVKILPAMETVLYGDNLSNVLATITNSTLDIIAWLPYGIIHFSSPFVVAIFIFLFAPPTSLRSFGFAFGYMNLLGVIIQILFPAAPPWYKNLYGLEPANYSMSGSPGGLGRIDAILGFDMYTTAFSNSPIIFGAFPSLHSACTVMDVLFLCWLFPKYRVVWWGWATWLWWSTMYLTHHYFIDLIGGAILTLLVFNYTKYVHLPVIDRNKFCRWSYSEVHKIDINESNPLSSSYNDVNESDIEAQPQIGFLNPAATSFPNFYNQPNNANANANEFEMASFSRSRQASRSLAPLTDSSSIGKSSSSINLPSSNPEFNEAEEVDTSLLENSSTPSVFEGENEHNHLISSAASSTSLDEVDATANTNNDTNPKSSNKKQKYAVKNR